MVVKAPKTVFLIPDLKNYGSIRDQRLKTRPNSVFLFFKTDNKSTEFEMGDGCMDGAYQLKKLIFIILIMLIL